MKQTLKRTKSFNTRRSVQRASQKNTPSHTWTLTSDDKTYVWTNQMERVGIIRHGIPFASIEVISKRLNKPVKSVLTIIGLPQTTYNKKKSDHAVLDSRNSELILLISELIDFGVEVFNNEEEKFQRWLRKPNMSLAGNSPENLLDTITGIHEVKYCLNRLDFGNLS
jgi:putative toxin-antitoxin system antitoxin component (TIGR02293 family)